MDKYFLNEEELGLYDSDGFGQSKNNEGTGLIKIAIKVRKDSMIPSFDAITDLKFFSTDIDEQNILTETVISMITESGGMFIEDILKLTERDIYSMAGKSTNLDDIEPIVALRALKKAVCNYFQNTGQDERYRKATETVICNCRHVTDTEIIELISKGITQYDEIEKLTGVGTGCGACKNKAKDFIETKLGKI